MPIQKIITLLQNVKGGPERFTARCPAHKDSHNSLSVGVGEDGRILLHCHAGCDTANVLDKLGLSFRDLYPERADYKDRPAKQPPAAEAPAPPDASSVFLNLPGTRQVFSAFLPPEQGRSAGEERSEPATEAAVENPFKNSTTQGNSLVSTDGPERNGENSIVKGLEQRLHKSADGETKMQICKFPSNIYPYRDAEGHVLFETVRLQTKEGGKTFRQRRRGDKGEWLYNLKGVEPVLYRLPEVRDCILAGRAGERGTSYSSNNDDSSSSANTSHSTLYNIRHDTTKSTGNSANFPGVVWLCEGEKDADALAALGLCTTTAPMGAGKWRPGYTESLRGAGHVYILPDHDKPGRAHALTVSTALGGAGIACSVVDLAALWPGLPKKGDVSDVLDKLGEEALAGFAAHALAPAAFAELAKSRDAEEDAPPYQFSPAADYMQNGFWRDVERNAAAPQISTGFAMLDRQLDGRLYPGLYVVGSVSSLGKTAFCLQMADAIAAQGQDVLFFTLEMSRLEMTGRSVVRELFLRCGADSRYSLGHLLHGKVEENDLETAVRAYAGGAAKHIAFIEGGFGMTVADVVERATRHYTATGRRPVVFVDYVQILRPADVRMSDKQAMDHNIIELKRLSRELDCPVIAVSSFNRQSYTEEVNMASFKESGAIEYSADFVMGLQARGISGASDTISDERKAARMVSTGTKTAKQQEPRPLEAVTLKNRRGPAWACFDLDFYPRQNYFSETVRG